MADFFMYFSPVTQALMATLFTWGMTAFGAALVFATRTINQRLLDSMLGFAGGIMIAASYWSLLAPAIDMSNGNSVGAWFPSAIGFLMGGVFLWGIDTVLPHLHPNTLAKRKDIRRKKKKKYIVGACNHVTQYSRRVGGWDYFWCACKWGNGSFFK